MTLVTQFPIFAQLIAFFGTLIAALLVVLTFVAWGNRRADKQREVIETFEFPAEVAQKVKLRYPHLTDDDVTLALQQLRLYFFLCKQMNGADLALPARVVDVCWHAFLLETRHYQRFCRQAFGQFLHHSPHRLAALSTDMINADTSETAKISLRDGALVYQAALARVDGVTCGSTTVSASGQVPMLFTIDQLLKIPDGYVYSEDFLHLLATFDLQKSRLSDLSSQGLSDSAPLDCGDGSASCGSCSGGH